MDDLRAIGADAFEAYLASYSNQQRPDLNILKWFADQCDSGRINESETARRHLREIEQAAKREAERRRHGAFDASTHVLQTKRVVQMSWFGFAGFQASDAFEVRRSIFRSIQERQFAAAVRLRFPGLLVLPNCSLHQIIDLDKLQGALPDPLIRYGRSCSLDMVLVTPREGDPVGAFELDSAYHDRHDMQTRDQWKNALLSAARIPLFRMRSEDPAATTIDEWYSILTEEVLDKIDCGRRIRARDLYATLVPLVR
jgi:Protein of unknown function (DUF2726)